MCGIAGSVHYPLSIGQVSALLAHRGPDEQQGWQDETVHLINTRLAIQGLGEDGRQPMHLQRYVIVFNGEIYNHRELREKYQLTCAGNSDTETILHLYRAIGKRMLAELDGMFAFCLYDREAGTLWMARDRCGEKPFYYYTHNDVLVFASELKALTALVKVNIDDQKISNFLAIGYLVGDQTPYREVRQLPAGHEAEYEIASGRLAVAPWCSRFDDFNQRPFEGAFQDGLEEADRLLNLSVKRRVRTSEREVGTFLSGGIDSGLMAAYAARHVTRLRTFTMAVDWLFDESPLAREVSNHLGTNHQEIHIGLNDLANDIETIFLNYGEPMVDDSIIPSYYVAREAARHVPVVLTGDGGDELFGGYRRYVPFSKIDFLSNRMRAVVAPLHRFMPFPRNKMHHYNYAYRFIGLLAKEWVEVYFAATLDLLHDFHEAFQVLPDYTAYSHLIEPVVDLKWAGLQKIMYLDNMTLLPEVLLKKMDIATMAHSLESRAPFLSAELLPFSAQLPVSWKIKGTKTKYLLRQLAQKHLPHHISQQPKRGFEIPLQQWVDNQLKTVIRDHLSPSTAYVKQIMTPAFVDHLLRDKNEFNPEKRAKALFALLSVEIWKRGNRS
jgi:asparagine synthase (glutamine-hydrolysing)